MLRTPLIVFLVGCCFLTVYCAPKMTPDEVKVLEALEGIRRGAEANIDYEQFVQLLESANTQINLLRQNSDSNACFLGPVDKCYSAYEIARKAWKRKMDESDEKRKAEMEITLSFSLSFASINIEKAINCFK